MLGSILFPLRIAQREVIVSFKYGFVFDSLRPSNNFSVMSRRVFLGWTSTKQRIKCLAQGHNAVPLVLYPLRVVHMRVYVNKSRNRKN